MIRGPRTFVAGAALAAVLSALTPLEARAQLAAKQAQARAIEARLREQGARLEMAAERYNRVSLELHRLEAASARYAYLRARLGRRVRQLYMHPGAPLDAFLGSKSLADLARAQALGASVLRADSQLIDQTEQARRQVVARSARLDALLGAARETEQNVAGERQSLQSQFAAQQALLQSVKGDIARLLDEQRQQAIEQAKKRASTAAPTPAGPKAADGGASPPPPVSAGAAKAVATARAQIGKPYQWGAAGPDSFDCSGLTMYAWAAAGVSMPHFAASQYEMFPHVSQSELQPGDLVFFGNPIHHVGIYEGSGVMIDAPETGENVRRDSIYRPDYAGASRP